MERELSTCPCKRTACVRHGDCAACKSYHHASGRKPLTSCERLLAKAERKTGRSRRA